MQIPSLRGHQIDAHTVARAFAPVDWATLPAPFGCSMTRDALGPALLSGYVKPGGGAGLRYVRVANNSPCTLTKGLAARSLAPSARRMRGAVWISRPARYISARIIVMMRRLLAG